MGNIGEWFNHLDGGGGVRAFMGQRGVSVSHTHTHAKLYLWLKEFNSWDPEAQRKGFRLFSELQAENQTNYRGYLSDLYQMLRGETIKGKKITSKSAKHPRQRKGFSAWTGAF